MIQFVVERGEGKGGEESLGLWVRILDSFVFLDVSVCVSRSLLCVLSPVWVRDHAFTICYFSSSFLHYRAK